MKRGYAFTGMEKDYKRLRRGIGEEAAERIVHDVKAQELEIKKDKKRQQVHQR